MIEVFALTTRGLESVSAHEMVQMPGLKLLQSGYRHITARARGPVSDLLQLRTVDDIFIRLAEWQGIGRPRDVLPKIQQLSAQLDLWPAAAARAQIRPLAEIPTFSVTASFVGRRNYTTQEIKQAVAAGIEAGHGWRYQENDEVSDVNIRLFIEHEIALVGMRLGDAPLHQRSYKQAHRSGSLKPPVAAALLALAEISPGIVVVDPFCGAGTILIEAASVGAVAKGGDSDPDAIIAARANARVAEVEVDLRRWDARALPLPDASAARIVTNLPWGRQIEVDADLSTFYSDTCVEMQRILVEDGRVVVLTSVPDLVIFPALHLVERREISLYGQNPTVMVFSTGS